MDARFADRFEKWKKTVDHHSLYSDTTAVRSNREYADLVDLGRPALPYLVEKLREGYFMLNDAVSSITKINIAELSQPVPISEQEVSKLWIQWWESNKTKEECRHA